jgi:hypothetical protein
VCVCAPCEMLRCAIVDFVDGLKYYRDHEAAVYESYPR